MNTFHKTTTLTCLALFVAALAGSAGCSMTASDWKPSKLFSLDNAWPWGDDMEEGVPVRVVGAWTDTVLTKPGQKPQRGFGGRLAFYGPESKKSMLVDGQLVVYAFDETGREPTDNKPTRRYVFPPETLHHHMSESELGATYSFWLPWDEAGGPKTEVSLICRFEPKGGSVVTGEQTKHQLPGSMPTASEITEQKGPTLPEGVPSKPARPTLESVQEQRRRDTATQMASFQSAGEPHVAMAAVGTQAIDPARKLDVTTIALPDNFQPHDVAAYLRSNMPAPQTANQPIQYAQPLQPMAPQQPAVPARQIMPQQAMPPTTNGAYMAPHAGASPMGGVTPAYMQQPNMQTVPMSNTHGPGYYSAPMPMSAPQSINGSPAMAMRPMAPMMSPQMVGAASPAGQPAAFGQQPAMYTMPPQQAGQQMPVQQGVQTRASYPAGVYPQVPAG